MTDFVSLLIEMRSGQVASDINSKFNEILGAVLETAGKGELTVKFKIQPSKLGMGGAVIEIETEHETKLKRPELKVGRSVFFVDKNGDLSRDNPAQSDMFVTEEEKEKKPNAGNKQRSN